MRRFLMIATIILMTSLISSITFATGRVLEPSAFQSNGDRVADWYWLRANGHTATWTFDVADLNAARPGSVFLNFAPLVTNRANGGSGHDVVCKVTVEGAMARMLSIPLNNPFRPMDPESSGGIGYQSFGHSATPIPAMDYTLTTPVYSPNQQVDTFRTYYIMIFFDKYDSNGANDGQCGMVITVRSI